MKTRWSTLLEIPQALEYAIANAEKGNLDPHIYNYPTLRIMRSENGDGTALVYLPVHTGIILESLGFAPNLTADQKVKAAISALTTVEHEAYMLGCREAVFISSDERTDEFCQKRLGYEKVSALRRRLIL